MSRTKTRKGGNRRRLRIGLTANDWTWRLLAVLCIPLFPFAVLAIHTRGKSLLDDAKEIAEDIGLTLVYGNYDNAHL